ncbi:multi-sensor signal transduction histidine kinase [Hyphomicrobium denitrificans 1NES1]|uniref:histidine kinase n=1 Tax=Hyphomicrobium denitrificans 1NES1 TaxID=670307 RepID=N0B7I6_9HYPH|nr:ATP-binding protein [Hyphomicrobium denitrificans]AGK56491.1 multi-sensor signal transduction histidine kinase [Hyphomicrobium denitrificans 1NES1]
MSLIKNQLSPETPANAYVGFAMLSAAALLALVPTWLYAGEPFRSGLLLLCGFIAGAAATLAWRIRRTPRKIAQTIANIAVDKSLSWTDLATAIPDPAIVLDRASVVLNYNAAALSIFERLTEGRTLEHINRDPELIAAVTGAFETGEKRTAKLLSRGGLGQRFIATVAPFGGGAHHPAVAALITIHDESEQQRALEMRTDFVANASHELRTPLASVRGFIETLQGPARHDEAAHDRFLKIMGEQAERMTRLIDDLLLLSRVEEKANLNPTGQVRLNELLNEVVRSLTPAADERRITMTVEPETSSLLAKGERDELFQVFHNLIENAVKYGREGGSVKVHMTENDRDSVRKRVTITVTDDGLGIAPEHLPRLTERFYRVSTEHSRRIGGTGLGLAIVKHILSRHQGELSVESVVGRGTIFKVVLPKYK